jgi:hemerythrin
MKNQLLWNESLETGIVELDIQHRNLFNIFKILRDAIENKKSSLVIKYIIEEVERYGEYHINAEEEILRKYQVLSESHYREHESFKKIVHDFKERYITTPDNILAEEISKYLYSWVTNHIMKIDMEDIRLLNEEFKKAGKL